MKNYCVALAIRGYFDCDNIKAESEQEAYEKAMQIVNETDFQELIDPIPELIDIYETPEE